MSFTVSELIFKVLLILALLCLISILLRVYYCLYLPWKIRSLRELLIADSDKNDFDAAFANFQKKKRYRRAKKTFDSIIAREIYLINKKKGVIYK